MFLSRQDRQCECAPFMPNVTLGHASKEDIELADAELLAKLNEVDMVATEAKHHRPYLSQFNNRYRNRNRKKGTVTNQLEVIKGLFYSVSCYMRNMHGISR